MNGHHLNMGTLVDVLTGRLIADTHDERYRQRIARLLLNVKGYTVPCIAAQVPIKIKADDKSAIVKVSFIITLDNRKAMIIQYGPGSLITRHRPALAISRLVSKYQAPVAVVTNGEQAHILDGISGKLTARGLDRIPSRNELTGTVAEIGYTSVSPKKMEMEARILYAFEIDDRCPCDDTVCKLRT
ncbi:MAG: type I restriction enzyme HsdR N-terminal domain-containing protein [Desulfobacteraceae bacterium]|nr:type I restriction enzyme HsdR N-terminal domain-containing protein [Desulfobacteraceae bacterium]